MNTPMRSSASETGSARDALTALYWAAVRAVAPGPALRAALEQIPPTDRGVQPWIIAVGKAAHPMAAAAVSVLAHQRVAPAGGVIVAPDSGPPPHAILDVVVGDHPVPGARSLAAAQAIGTVAAQVQPSDEAWVLLSGGATSLAAAPNGDVEPDELFALYRRLLGAGLEIREMNRIRKRFSRWGAGRLAAALAPATVRNYIVSDVIGDDLSAIGSGPCVPDDSSANDIRAMLVDAGLWEHLAPSLRRTLEDPSRETPKGGDGAFAHVETRIVASNRVALEAIAARAHALGYEPHILERTLAGEASVVGRRLVATMATYRDPSNATPPNRAGVPCLIWGGETTVTVGDAPGRGGRCQELALSAAQTLSQTTDLDAALLLAAGTDGRDGDTDAAGAIVSSRTWQAIRAAGRDPARDLARHDSYPSLDSAHALLRTGLTGTNVMDVVIALVP